MNAGIAFISRKSRKTDVAWRYAIAVVLVVCCIGLAYVEIVVAPWFINEVVSMFPETTLLKEPSMFWEWAILLAVQATLLCTAAKLVVPERLLAQAAGLLDMIRIVALIVVFSVTTTGNITICLMNFGTPGFVYGVALCSLAAIIAIIVLLCTAALQHLLHADVIWSESHAFVEGLGFGVAGPDVERYVVAAGLTGEVEHVAIQGGAYMVAAGPLVNA
ncbi:hypothetical protein MCC10066_1497 [Bifidobacterium longum subsp. longum]|nr:hypothetical protein MCC10066_1497 [Bifidobacterium longum subsp. longum]